MGRQSPSWDEISFWGKKSVFINQLFSIQGSRKLQRHALEKHRKRLDKAERTEKEKKKLLLHLSDLGEQRPLPQILVSDDLFSICLISFPAHR